MYGKIDGLTPKTQAAFSALHQQAKQAGMTLEVISGYRSIERQLAIWNNKANPEYLFTIDGDSVPAAKLSESQWLDAVMQWSAVPGLSRHHWGTDIDVIDTSALPDGYRVQLVPEEYADTGVFSQLGTWLNEAIDVHHADGFFRPYRSISNGVSPEAWHLSFYPEADELLNQLLATEPSEVIPFDEMFAGEALKQQIDEVIDHYVRNIDAHK